MHSPSSDSVRQADVPLGLSDPVVGTTCILVNPHSFRIRGGARLDRVCAAARRSGMPLHVVRQPDEIAAAMKTHRQAPPERLIIIGGDGTVQATLSALADDPPSMLPKLLVLGGGRTNFTARDLGSHSTPVRLLQRALRAPGEFKTEQRRILTLKQAASERQVHGFFVAGALVDHVIRDCHQYRTRHRGWLRTGHPSSAWRVMQLAALGALGHDRFTPPPMRINAGSLGNLDQPLRILIMSSLEHQRGWINPYARRGTGAVRLTAVSSTAAGLWRSLPALLKGRSGPSQTPENGYLSGYSEKVVVRGLSSVCIDGQEYEFLPEQDVVVRPGPDFSFLVP